MRDILLAHSSPGPGLDQAATDCFYYSQAWMDLVSDLYGYPIVRLTTSNSSGQTSGILPVCLLDSWPRGRRLVTLPFSDHCPLLAVDEASANELIDQAIQLANQRRASYLELRTGVNQTIARRSDLIEGNLYVRWLMPLSADVDAMWSALRKPIQHQIKKSRKLGVQVRNVTTREEVAHYHRLHLYTRTKKHGMPAQSLAFFQRLWDACTVDGAMQVLLAEYQGEIIAGMIVLASGTTVRYAYGASLPDYLHLAPNNLLLWSAIAWGCTNGYRDFDLGRTARDNHGLMEFKRRWGAIQEPLPYYYYPRVAGLAATAEHSWKFRALTTCWKRLPVSIAGPVGGHLYKYLG